MAHPAVLLVGGKGTRVAALTGPVLPKALLPVCGAPFIDFKLRQLAAGGVGEVLLLVGHGAEPLEAHLGDGKRLGLRVRYVADPPGLLGTGGALGSAYDVLPDRFWLTYGDTFLPVDIEEIETKFAEQDRPALMTVLHNEDAWGPSNVAVEAGRVVEYRKSAPAGTFRFIDYGLLLLPRRVFGERPPDVRFDLEVVLQELIADDALAAFEVKERFWEIGTPEALAETERHLLEVGAAATLGIELPEDV